MEKFMNKRTNCRFFFVVYFKINGRHYMHKTLHLKDPSFNKKKKTHTVSLTICIDMCNGTKNRIIKIINSNHNFDIKKDFWKKIKNIKLLLKTPFKYLTENVCTLSVCQYIQFHIFTHIKFIKNPEYTTIFWCEKKI